MAQSGGFLRDEPPVANDSDDLFDLDVPEEAPEQAQATKTNIKPLSQSQERRLTIWLDDRFLQLSRGISKRHHPGSPFDSLAALLNFSKQLLHVILSIPPFQSGNILRAEFLLRLTGEVTSGVLDYRELKTISGRQLLFAAFDQVDRAWELVLLAKAWSPESPATAQKASISTPLASDVTGTQKTRLLSLCQRFKTDLSGVLDDNSLAEHSMATTEAEDSDNDSSVESESNDEAMTEAGLTTGGQESVLHTELDLKRVFARTLKLIAL